MPVRCMFDMLDNCVAYDNGQYYAEYTLEINAPVTSGEYMLPNDVDPLGKSASDLWKYRV